MTDKPVRPIRSRSIVLSDTVTVPGSLFAPPQKIRIPARKVLDSQRLIDTLFNLADGTHETHTRNNLHTLIRQINSLGLDV